MAIKTSDRIRAASRGTPTQAIATFRNWGSFPMGDVEDATNETYRLCDLVTMDASILVSHMALETGSQDNGRAFLYQNWAVVDAYRSTKNRYNPSGLGITDGPDFGIGFAGGIEAARAHVVHWARYVIPANDPAWKHLEPYIALDLRWDAVADAGWVASVVTLADMQGKWWTTKGGDQNLCSRGMQIFPGIADQGVTETPKPAPDDVTSYAPARLLAYLDGADPKAPVIRDGRNIFFRVNWKAVALRTTPRFQRAAMGAAKRGPDMKPGEPADIAWAWIEADGTLWLYSSWGTRFYGPDFILDTGAVLPTPDPDPDGVIIPTTPPVVVVPGDPDWLRADPASLLPDLDWVGSPNYFPNREGLRLGPLALAYHITDDLNYESTRSWFMNPNSNASSHIVILRDGTPHQYVSSKDASWTNGDYAKYRTDIPWLVEAIAKGHNVNDYTLSYEFVANGSNPPTKAQYETAIKLSRYFTRVYGIPRNRGHNIRHSDVNSVSRSYCPGDAFELEYIIVEGLGGDATAMS